MYNIELGLYKNLSVNFDRAKTLQVEPLFNVSRFAVRNIKIESNVYHNHVHSFLISGEEANNELIVLCLIENGRGGIQTIKSYRKQEMDKELAGYIMEATLEILNENYKFERDIIKMVS